MEIIAPINAIISWEGYEIQGHIALCVALEKIKENIISGNSNDLWNLEIEGKEDFSFLYDGRYVSMHQVKSGKVNLKRMTNLLLLRNYCRMKLNMVISISIVHRKYQ